MKKHFNKRMIFIVGMLTMVCFCSIGATALDIEEDYSKKNKIDDSLIWRKDVNEILAMEWMGDSGELFRDSEGRIMLDVPLICQYPILETGCESVSATMVLQYYGELLDAETFASNWLLYDDVFYTKDGVLYGPNPYEVFVGNPVLSSGYGCFAPVIEKTVNLKSSLCVAETIVDETLDDLCETYINRGKPLLIWATMEMEKPWGSASWFISEWVSFTWPAAEHCMVLVGYDEANYYLNDPMTGTVVSYEKEIVQKRFEELGSQAVCISRKNSL